MDAFFLPSQRRLVEAAADGDRHAQETLLTSFRPKLIRYLAARTRTREDCEDLAQTVVVEALQSFHRFRGESAFWTWLRAIANNHLRNYYTRELPETSRFRPLEELSGENFGTREAPAGQISQDAHTALKDKDYVQCLLTVTATVCSGPESVILLLYYRGESFREIADMLDMKGATVRSHFLRARTKLLIHIFQRDPSLVGGDEELGRACARLAASQLECDRLTRPELNALENPALHDKNLGSAYLKVARYIMLALTLVAGGPA